MSSSSSPSDRDNHTSASGAAGRNEESVRDRPVYYAELVFNVPVPGPFTYRVPEGMAAEVDEGAAADGPGDSGRAADSGRVGGPGELDQAAGSGRVGGPGELEPAADPGSSAEDSAPGHLRAAGGPAGEGSASGDPPVDAGLPDRRAPAGEKASPATPGSHVVVRRGVRAVAPFGRRTLTGFVLRVTSEPPDLDRVREISRVVDEAPLFGEGELELARWLSKLYLCSTGEALSAMLPGGRREKEPEAIGLGESIDAASTHDLSDEQRAAVDAICEGAQGRFYVEGITGSGKTEVFLRAAERTLQEGRGVVYLVPEIALTGQLHSAVRSRFGEQVAIIHSRMTPSQRLTEWRRLQSGEARIAMGARSAVFAPVGNPGLFIVDEEHEGSYKSGSAPRYHARQVALYRAKKAGARLVLGSATPSVEAAAQMDSGGLKRLPLTRRLAGGQEPEIETIDLKKDPGILSERLCEAIRATHAEGLQTILFLNRRGFANFFHCRSCGYRMSCSRCSVSMTYHKGLHRMVCHHCGYRSRPPEICPECGSLDIAFGGYGTERVEEAVRNTFPNLRCARVDGDTTKKRGSLEATLTAFHDGEVDILLGTQMVAKGLNFPGVGLVGIVLADTGLAMPDFRAGERTWSLIVQVAGRAGRFRPDGKVLVQTYNPEHPAVASAVSGSYRRFYEQELATRRELGFPPYARLFRVVLRARTAKKAAEAAVTFADAAERAFTAGEDLLGPAECPLAVVNGNHRHHLLILSRSFDRTHAALSSLLASVPVPSGVYREVDVDPVAVL